MKKYIIAIAIVLSTIIYVFGNRYYFNPNTANAKPTVFDKFTSKIYLQNGMIDYVDGTFANQKYVKED